MEILIDFSLTKQCPFISDSYLIAEGIEKRTVSMTSLKLLKILLLMLQFRSCFVTCFEETQNSRNFDGAVFTQENARLLHHKLKRVKVVSAISCSQACLAHPRCISTNFKIVQQSQSMICELNDFGISPCPRDREDLHVQGGFLYTQYFVNNVSKPQILLHW